MLIFSAPLPTLPKPESPVIVSPKSDTAANQNTLSINSSQSKSLSDTEVDIGKTDAEDGSPTKRVEKDNVLPPEVA